MGDRNDSGRSTLREQLLAAAVAQKQGQDQDMANMERQHLGRSNAINEQQTLVEKAARDAFTELAEVLGQVRGQRFDISTPSGGSDRVQQLFALKVDRRTVIFARTENFYGTLRGGNDPLVRWPDEATRRARRLPEPPHEGFLPPFWLLYDDMGGFRSPSTIIHGAVVSSTARVDRKTWTYTLQLHGSNPSDWSSVPTILDGFDAVREYWIRVGAAALDMHLP